MKDRDGRLQAYIRCCLKGDRIVPGKMLAKSVSYVVCKSMVCVERSDDLVSGQESLFSFIEQSRYTLTTGVVRKNRSGEVLCGDNFSMLKLDNGKAVCMLSDGMGSGENAYIKSRQVMDLLEQLLSAGFGRELAVELLNSFISFLTGGGGSATLDLTMFDLYNGWTSFIKLGASTTFIKREDNVECISSTSLPMGVLEEIEFDTCDRKLYHGDIVVMVSDGVLDGINVNDREGFLAQLIMDADTENVQKLSKIIMDEVERQQNGQLKDDSTILAIGLWER
jgi:stage II sporulation protein E